ncbi:hypothetical protein FOMG_20023 [Fusarium oxysporum f. sp. melonis 26406]|uniref:Uncharacterized protein n=1 Tax=Fusarium oxysporum f. sp. melonis 26406 TaxID=1089452 RepID=W9ZPY3_FUSOX|nr:hypothetical protein FOMG_20023 [Fusarium oxysporum f. sp. melonis 26406]
MRLLSSRRAPAIVFQSARIFSARLDELQASNIFFEIQGVTEPEFYLEDHEEDGDENQAEIPEYVYPFPTDEYYLEEPTIFYGWLSQHARINRPVSERLEN